MYDGNYEVIQVIPFPPVVFASTKYIMDYDDKPSIGETVCCVGRSPLNIDASIAKHLYLVPWIVMAVTSWILRLVSIGPHRIHRTRPSRGR